MEVPDGATSCLDSVPVISLDALWKLVEADKEAGAVDCCKARRFIGLTDDVAISGVLLDKEPFTVDVDAPVEDTEDPSEGGGDGSLDEVEELLRDVDEGLVEDVEEDPLEDKTEREAEFCATGFDEGAACIPAVKDNGFDVDAVDESLDVEDRPLSSVTGQTVV